MENILVVGATGTTGKKVVELLKATQYFKPVAMVRKQNQMEEFHKNDIATVLGDLEEDVKHVTKNIDKVVFAAGSGGKKVVEVDQEGAKKIIDASKNATIKKFVMLSSIGADNPEKADDLKEYLVAKHKADEHLKASSLTYAIVRPGTLNNEKGTGKITLEEKLDTNNEISRDDVAQTLVRSLHDDVAINKTFEIVQGEVLIGKAMDTISQ